MPLAKRPTYREGENRVHAADLRWRRQESVHKLGAVVGEVEEGDCEVGHLVELRLPPVPAQHEQADHKLHEIAPDDRPPVDLR